MSTPAIPGGDSPMAAQLQQELERKEKERREAEDERDQMRDLMNEKEALLDERLLVMII